ncbi:hypothetical protein [Aliivibrio sifiae]|uniref:Uncharacterized protein n=2 Tax=Aliivibrio sifiae TaxID=566293 RepID=A0A2S7XG65_9GAMM|nr:hypothetical protein [Aliivibrio sifiae]PQJ92704.1 hypothetical protein BTO23_01035 [Aliivibrio sifiae]
MKRLISQEDLPETVWCSIKSEMQLPDNLVSSWVQLLTNNGLEELAKTPAEQGFIGGISQEDTNKHLAWRYNGSCARVILSMLDPKHELTEVSNAYAKLFSGNRVFLADIPSGSGAAAISILCTFAELRKKDVLPRHPLEVVIVAGEISQFALDYYKTQLEFIAPMLAEQAIKIVESSFVHWDILNKQSTTNLIREMTVKSVNCQSRMLVVCNFSGFLASDSGRWKKATVPLEEIFRHSTDDNSAVIWIEPQTNKVTSFFSKLRDWFSDKLSYLMSDQQKTEQLNSTAICKHSLIDGEFRVQLSVHRFDLPRNN